jgi:hypothetical protein
VIRVNGPLIGAVGAADEDAGVGGAATVEVAGVGVGLIVRDVVDTIDAGVGVGLSEPVDVTCTLFGVGVGLND